MRQLTNKTARERDWKIGEVVLYKTGGRQFGAAVETEPWNLGGDPPLNRLPIRVVNLCGLGPDYQQAVSKERTRVNAAYCEALRLAPVVLDSKTLQWELSSVYPLAVVRNLVTDSKESAMGWRWSAAGRSACANSYLEAVGAAGDYIRQAMGKLVRELQAIGRP